MFPKHKRIRSKKILESARGEQCTVQLNGICNHDPETVVFAHLGGAGMGLKQHDYNGCYCCASCHDEVDRRTRLLDAEYVDHQFRIGMQRTLDILVEKGLVVIK